MTENGVFATMQDQDWTRMISQAVVPAVIISASALMCLAFYNRLASVVSRLRAFQRERLSEQALIAELARSGDSGASEPDQQRHQALEKVLSDQTERVIRRARLLRRTLQCLLAAIASELLCSILIGVSLFWHWAVYAAVGVFFWGLALVLCAVLFALSELRTALDPVELEMRMVAQLSERSSNPPADASDAG